ncbi:hypothetical protein PCASD_02204 [Puccinia coronata f. sp. avenae]|uniref:Uncharacterized protein n=1 Tax=Puccinia coronata f. sp. avenae TaxID=200324 RepID=A0A2N5VI15_9BASI|nr:hypothetical protein PCASD_02204 [Puccinia coronata f. sp. avenae]
MDSPHNGTLGDITLPAIDPIIDSLDTSFYEAHQGNENNPESHAANPLEISPSTAEIRVLQDIFHLDNHHLHKALEMPTGTLSALVFGVIAGVQERALRHGQSDPIGPAGLPESTAAKQFIFTAIAKDKIRDISKEVFLQPNVDAYSRGRYKMGMGDRSFVYLTIQGVKELDLDFKKDFLPPGFVKHDPQAQSKVLLLVRDIHKHFRGTIRDLLLHNVIDREGKHMRTVPVPPIQEIQTIDTLIHHDGLKQSQWDTIDDQIHQLKALGADYRAAHMKALLQKDHALFGQDKALFDVDKSAIVMPTEAEVRALIAPKQSTSAA